MSNTENPSPGGTTELEERSRKCKHPEESVLTISGKHQPWEGTCGECGVDVRLRATSSGEVEANNAYEQEHQN